jgi:hypothetical protein
MQWLKRIGILPILAPGLIMVLAGCAGTSVNKTLQAEEALAAAGFQLKMADTPAKLDRIRRMPQKQVVRGMIKDREAYIWADGEGCLCCYTGTRQNYEQLRYNQRSAENRFYYPCLHLPQIQKILTIGDFRIPTHDPRRRRFCTGSGTGIEIIRTGPTTAVPPG